MRKWAILYSVGGNITWELSGKNFGNMYENVNCPVVRRFCIRIFIMSRIVYNVTRLKTTSVSFSKGLGKFGQDTQLNTTQPFKIVVWLYLTLQTMCTEQFVGQEETLLSTSRYTFSWSNNLIDVRQINKRK